MLGAIRPRSTLHAFYMMHPQCPRRPPFPRMHHSDTVSTACNNTRRTVKKPLSRNQWFDGQSAHKYYLKWLHWAWFLCTGGSNPVNLKGTVSSDGGRPGSSYRAYSRRHDIKRQCPKGVQGTFPPVFFFCHVLSESVCYIACVAGTDHEKKGREKQEKNDSKCTSDGALTF
jgi:hypothetical protein